MASDAMTAIEAGDKLAAEKNYEEALVKYLEAIELLPESERTFDQRQTALGRFVDASARRARQQADAGQYDAARTSLYKATEIDPEHGPSLRLLEDLDDPEIYSPAMTEEYVNDVEKVKEGLQLAVSYRDLGRYDKALEALNNVLRVDRYNAAARRLQTQIEIERQTYFQDARAHTRKKMLREVSEAWETMVPPRESL